MQNCFYDGVTITAYTVYAMVCGVCSRCSECAQGCVEATRSNVWDVISRALSPSGFEGAKSRGITS